MNRVYKLVWSRKFRALVAAAETAHAQGKKAAGGTVGAMPTGARRLAAARRGAQLACGIAFALLVPARFAGATSLLLNGDFSTGDFTDWTLSGNTGFTSVQCGGTAPDACYANIGPVGSLGYLTQSFATSSGDYLLISYDFQNDGATPNVFQVSFDGTYLFNQSNGPAQNFTNYYFYVLANSVSSSLQFGYQDDPGYQQLSNISVVDVGTNYSGPLGQPQQGGGGSSNITQPSTSASGLAGGTVNPVFDGGTLLLDGTTLGSTYTFTITGNGGTVDLGGNSATIGTGIADSTPGTPGALTVSNSGSGGELVLAGADTYTGTTTVDAGATLVLANAQALGGGGDLVLNGSLTTPATLVIDQTMTIGNAITVSGDPVFDVAPGTTTTISSTIADGGTPGDVVLNSDGVSTGTLALTAANTYTGTTTVDAGTLALSGAGSIATSSSVTNNGTFDITGVSGNVGVQNYSQGSGGTLAMTVAPSGNQQLTVTGTASLAGTLDLAASAGTYHSGRYTLVTSTGALSGAFSTLATNLASYTPLAFTLGYDGNDAYLILAPNHADTQASVNQLAAALQAPFMLQTSELDANLDNDCSVFDKNGVCVGAAGGYTVVDGDGPHQSSALVFGAYRVGDHLRVGAWADQGFSAQTQSTAVSYGSTNPMVGAYGVWAQHPGESGYEVRVAAGYGDQNLTLARAATGSAEPGTGSSRFNVQGASAELSYDSPLSGGWVASPYAGLRYTKAVLGAYTEQASATVSDPLSYGSVVAETTTALAGVRLSGHIDSRIVASASVGIEQDLSSRYGDLAASNGTIASVNGAGLSAVSINGNPQHTRPVASVGASVDLGHAQQIGVSLAYAQQPFGTVGATSAQVRYTAGF